MSKSVKIKENSVFIGGVEYAPVSSLKSNETVKNTEGLEYVIIRTYSAGVHMGYLKSRKSTLAGIEVQLVETRRIYSWAGALTLSEMSQIGVKDPANCKFSMAIPKIDILAIEIIPVSEEAIKTFNKVKWELEK